MKKGDVVVATNVCFMIEGQYESLTIGREYELTYADDEWITIIDDNSEEHSFSIITDPNNDTTHWRKYFKLPNEELWYESLNGIQFLYKYPSPFIEWINKKDGEEGASWAETYAHKYNITHITKLFDLWVNETY